MLKVALKQQSGWAGPDGSTNEGIALSTVGEPNPCTHRTLDNETRYTLLRRLGHNPEVSQRELAKDLGISLGKTNYCLKALLDKGYIKAENFRNSQNKRAYLYQLTPAGITAKSHATARFLARKQAEYEWLAQEIKALKQEMQWQANTHRDDKQPCRHNEHPKLHPWPRTRYKVVQLLNGHRNSPHPKRKRLKTSQHNVYAPDSTTTASHT